MDLDGKVVIVTGAAGGIGSGMCSAVHRRRCDGDRCGSWLLGKGFVPAT